MCWLLQAVMCEARERETSCAEISRQASRLSEVAFLPNPMPARSGRLPDQDGYAFQRGWLKVKNRDYWRYPFERDGFAKRSAKPS
jgi:hypothetical protein